MKPTKHNAFTLVELIVVITILAILGTISFLSFGSQSASARDSVRLADMTNITKWLSINYASSWKYPIPDNPISITASGVAVWYQWYAWVNIINMIKLSSWWWKDPSDKTYYSYSTNYNQNKFEILGFLEDGNNISLSLAPFSNDVSNAVSSYSGRYVLTKWDMLWVLLTSWTQLPIQEPWVLPSNTLELTTSTWWAYYAVLNSKQIISWSWTGLWWLLWLSNIRSSWSKYPNCDTNDIILPNSQTWAACNVWATTSYNESTAIQDCASSVTDCNSSIRYTIWSFFQFWRNDDVTSSSITSTLAPAWTLASNVGHNLFISSNSDWISTQNDDLWWWSWTSSTYWTFSSLSSPISMQGPCANWYHVPTLKEWVDAINSLNPSIIIAGSESSDITVRTVLRLPVTWKRAVLSGAYSQWNYWFYKTSTPVTASTSVYVVWITQKGVSPTVPWNRTAAQPVRCMKN